MGWKCQRCETYHEHLPQCEVCGFLCDESRSGSKSKGGDGELMWLIWREDGNQEEAIHLAGAQINARRDILVQIWFPHGRWEVMFCHTEDRDSFLALIIEAIRGKQSFVDATHIDLTYCWLDDS